MRELAIQAEVGRRLRAAIGRTNRVLRRNARTCKCNDRDDDVGPIIEALIESGHFTSEDKNGLLHMRREVIHDLGKRFLSESDDEEEDGETPLDEESLRMMHRSPMTNEELEDFAHGHRPKENRAIAVQAHKRRHLSANAAVRLPEFDANDNAAIGMAAGSSLDEVYANRRKEKRGY